MLVTLRVLRVIKNSKVFISIRKLWALNISQGNQVSV